MSYLDRVGGNSMNEVTATEDFKDWDVSYTSLWGIRSSGPN